jgi:hypothetical protein
MKGVAAWHGEARPGLARSGAAGAVGLGEARQGSAGHGVAVRAK